MKRACAGFLSAAIVYVRQQAQEIVSIEGLLLLSEGSNTQYPLE